jgi:hypothetical protein
LTIKGFLCSQLSGVWYTAAAAVMPGAMAVNLVEWSAKDTIKLEGRGFSLRAEQLLN